MGSVLDSIAAQRVLPVLRCGDVADAVSTARALARAGMRVVELTRSTPDVEEAIAILHDEGLLVGLGTVTAAEQIKPAVAAGASFVVSFCAPDGLIETAHGEGVAAIPGAFTPSEIERCHRHGADAVKLFPARQLSPQYIHELRAVMPGLRLLPTGGIEPSPASVRPWLAAGALAVGIGGALGSAASVGSIEVEQRADRALRAARGA